MGILSDLLVRAAPSKRALQFDMYLISLVNRYMFIKILLHAKLEVWGSVLLLVNVIDEERALEGLISL